MKLLQVLLLQPFILLIVPFFVVGAFILPSSASFRRASAVEDGTAALLASIITGPQGKPASSKEEDLQLTLAIIRDHDARSTTVSKDQFIQQMEAVATVPADEKVDVSVPYDAAAMLAYEANDDKSTMTFDNFKTQYVADAIALVKSKRQQPTIAADDDEEPPTKKAESTTSTTSKIYSGTVKWFDLKKGFGFITRNDDGRDLFVHQTDIYDEGFRSVNNGEEVEYQVAIGDNGREKAVHVTAPNGELLKRGFAYKK